MEQMEVGSDSCGGGTCSTFFSLYPLNQAYRINVSTVSILGSSDPATHDSALCKLYVSYNQRCVKLTSRFFIRSDGSIASFFGHSLNFEDCVTTANCSTTLSEMSNCTIQYGKNSSYQDLGPPISAPLNSSFSLPLMKSSTLYYVQITFMLNSQPVILRRNYTTGNGILYNSCGRFVMTT